MSFSLDQIRSLPDAGSAFQGCERSSASQPANDDVESFQRALEAKPDSLERNLERQSKTAAESGRSLEQPSKAAAESSARNGRPCGTPVDEVKTRPSREDARTGSSPNALFGQTQDDGLLDAESFLASMFRSSQAGGQPLGGQAAVSTAAVSEAAPLDSDAIDKVVSRILVSAPGSDNAQVRLSISDSVLRSTEIVLSRDALGQLSVKITSSDPQSLQTIAASRTDLVRQLEGREPMPVIVTLESNAEDNDSRRRSRGLDEMPEEPAP